MVFSRRDVLKGAMAATAGVLSQAPASVFGLEDAGEGKSVPFLDPQPIDPKRPMVKWEELTDWLTPDGQFFAVNHYGTANVSAEGWKLGVEGMIERPISLSLDDIKARPRRDAPYTLECSGNGAGPGFMGAIGNARWAGTPLAPLLKECAPKATAGEVVFWGADHNKEKVHGDIEFDAQFARSLPLHEAMREDVLLAYEMNGKPLSAAHGFPLRLIVPGWYGIAWVKWLERIELLDRPFLNRFMGRDYVTVRGEERDGKTIWRETSVGPMNVKSLIGRVVREKDGTLLVAGAAWTDGTPLKSVEVKIDDDSWAAAQLDPRHDELNCWRFWSYRWKDPRPGEHTLVSRATDEKGRVQPTADDPAIRLKKTYWEANAQYPRRIRL